MARQRHLDEVRFKLQVLQGYGVLVAFDGLVPAKLPAVTSDNAKETFRAWKERVFPGSAERVRVYLATEPAPQARLHKLVEQGPRVELKAVLTHHRRAVANTRVSKALRSEARAKRLISEAKRRSDLLDAAAAGQVRRETSSRLDQLASDLDAWLERATGLDPLVAAKARELQQRIAAGEAVNEVIGELIFYASECRALVSRSISRGQQS